MTVLLTACYYRNQWHRFQNFIDSAFLLAEKSEQKIELVIVEWNPPADKRRILDTFVSSSHRGEIYF